MFACVSSYLLAWSLMRLEILKHDVLMDGATLLLTQEPLVKGFYTVQSNRTITGTLDLAKKKKNLK